MSNAPVNHPISRLGSASVWIATACCCASAGYCGGVKFDGSFGSAGALNGPNFFIPADRGKQVGGNLFHSFSDFNLLKDDVANFQGPSNVQNILARVTGGSSSSIDGTLRSEISGANLYFINPAGVMFGPNAKLDLSGSFTVTTAAYVKLSDGARFDAHPSANDFTLTAAPVSAFGFLAPAPAPVSFTGSRLATQPAADFSVIAGDVTLDGATVAVPSGKLSLVSLAAAGEVPALPDTLAMQPAAMMRAMGAIELKNKASANIDGDGGGRIVIRGGRFTLTGGSIIGSKNSGPARGGDVDVGLTGTLAIYDGQIGASTLGSGDGGDVKVDAPMIAIDGQGLDSFTGISSDVLEGAVGKGGNVTVRSGDLVIAGGGEIFADTAGLGDGGRVNISATKLRIDGQGLGFFTDISSDVLGGAVGKGGDVAVRSDDLVIIGGGAIAANTFGLGDGGRINVSAAKLRIDGQGLDSFTGISSAVLADANGKVGNVIVRSGDLAIIGGGAISADTSGQGDGGNVNVSAAKLRIDGQGLGFFTGISSDVIEGAVGNGGNVIVRSDDLVMISGGQISASIFGKGDGGTVDVSTQRLRIVGQSAGDLTGIFANVNLGGIGKGGDVTVHADSIFLGDGGRIVARLFGTGQGGSVQVDARHIDIAGGKISADTFGDGDGGSVTVSAGTLLIDSTTTKALGEIGANVGEAAHGHGGNVSIRASEMTISGGGSVSTDTAGRGNGGNLEIVAAKLVLDRKGLPFITAISADVSETATGRGGDVTVRSDDLSIVGGAEISAKTAGLGRGGNVNVSADKLRIDGQGLALFDGISAGVLQGGTGDGGDVTIRSADASIAGGGQITADTAGRGAGGNVSVATDRLCIDGRFTGLSADVLAGATGDGGNVMVRADQLAISNLGFISANVTAGASGNAGDIVVQAGEISITRRGFISASTFGRGDGGNLTITANRLMIDDGGTDAVTGIFASVNSQASGTGGNVRVQSRDITIGNNGRIVARTFGQGNAGDVVVDSRSLRIAGSGGILADVNPSAIGHGGDIKVRSDLLTITGGGEISAATGGQGDGGSVFVSSEDLVIRDGAAISASSFGAGDGGSVHVQADRLGINGTALEDPTGIFATAHSSTAAAGDLDLRAGVLSISGPGARISVFSDRTRGGDIEIRVSSRASIENGGSISASAGSSGGNITLRIRDSLFVDHGSIVATAGTTLLADAHGSSAGVGGNIAIDPTFVILDHATISANAAIGRGGNVFLQADNFFSSQSFITASGSTVGTVEIAAPELDLAAGLVILPGSLVDPSTQLREQCARRLGLDFSDFVVVGRGGVELGPDEALTASVPSRERKEKR